MAFISVEGIGRTYGNDKRPVKALVNVSFNIEQGEFAVILGPSGSGKSTLLNLLGGMDRATRGRIICDDIDVTALNEKQITNYRRTDVGFVFQFYNLIPSLNTYENINIAARIGRDPFDAKAIMAAVGMEKRGKHFPAELSGGEQQRTAIARAIVKNPKLLLCDEPTGALDTMTGQMVLELLHDMSRKYGKTVLIVTHNRAMATVADKVIELRDGKVIDAQMQTGKPTQINKQEHENRQTPGNIDYQKKDKQPDTRPPLKDFFHESDFVRWKESLRENSRGDPQ